MSGEMPHISVATLSVTLQPSANGSVRVVVAGEVDMSNADHLNEALAVAIDFAQSIVVIDLAAVSFLGSSGVAVLVAAYRRAARAGVPLAVVNCIPIVRQVLEVTGVWKVRSRGA
jgi:anti-anti-sigma factor